MGEEAVASKRGEDLEVRRGLRALNHAGEAVCMYEDCRGLVRVVWGA